MRPKLVNILGNLYFFGKEVLQDAYDGQFVVERVSEEFSIEFIGVGCDSVIFLGILVI